MSDLWVNLLKHLKFYHILITVVVAGIVVGLIWAAAHLSSEPGTTVKVLWGLVEYTKSPRVEEKEDGDLKPPVDQASRKDSTVDAPEDSINREDPTPLSGINYTHGVTVENLYELIKQIREKHGLRELRPLETGKEMSKTPPGTFFFVFHMGIKYDPDARLERDRLYSAEVHHREQGEFIVICYTTESDVERVRLRKIQEITVFFQPWEDHTTLLELPLERISEAKARTITTADQDALYVLDIVVR